MPSFWDMQKRLAARRRASPRDDGSSRAPAQSGGREAPRAPGAPAAALTVSQLTSRIKNILQEGLPGQIIVRGEISEWSHAASGHRYFCLKDKTSSLNCVMWQTDAASLHFEPQAMLRPLVSRASQPARHPYLNDRLAGSVAAIELIEHWSAAETDAAVRTFLDAQLADIQADQQTLRDVLQSVGGSESTVKKSAAWLSEKLGRLKMAATGSSPAARGFYRLEQFDLLVAGVRGKQALWEALGAGCAGDARMGPFDWQALARSAREQIDRIERHRLEAARLAFA